MGNMKMLREKIKDSGLKLVYIADSIGITAQSLSNKLDGNSEFKASEITALSSILKLSRKDRDDIFLS